MNMYSWHVRFTVTWVKMESWKTPLYWGPAEEEGPVKEAKGRGNRGRKNTERKGIMSGTLAPPAIGSIIDGNLFIISEPLLFFSVKWG